MGVIMNLDQSVYTLLELIELTGSRRSAEKLIEAEDFLKISHGLYSNVSDPVRETMILLSKYYPEAVISGSSALLYQELSDRMDEKIHVDIPRDVHMRESRFLEFHRVSESRRTGIEEKNIAGVMVKIYSRERTLFEAQKFSMPSLYNAVKAYVRGAIDYKELTRLDEIFGGEVLTLVRHEKSDASF
jgi:predicted transcriptional regulator of viral defense system